MCRWLCRQDLLKSGTAEVTKSSLDKIFANVEGVTTVNKELLKVRSVAALCWSR